MKNYVSEFLGTLVLVLVGCGVAVLTGANVVATSLAFGLSVVAMAYSVGSISGGHFNPSVTIAYFLDKKITLKESIYYIVAQLIGGFLGSLMVALCNRGNFDRLASNQIGYYLIINILIKKIWKVMIEMKLFVLKVTNQNH